MARLLGCAYAAAAVLGGQQVAPVLLVEAPTPWAYHLTDACTWTPRAWVKVLGPRTPDPLADDLPGRRAEWSCLHRKGLKSMVIFSAQIEQRWPNPATIAKWESEDAQHDPPRPDWRFAAEPD